MQRAEQFIVVPFEGQLSSLEANEPDDIEPLVMADEEAGEVQRVSSLVGSLPLPRTMAETMDPSLVCEVAKQAAKNMLLDGVTMDLAPVLGLIAVQDPTPCIPMGLDRSAPTQQWPRNMDWDWPRGFRREV